MGEDGVTGHVSAAWLTAATAPPEPADPSAPWWLQAVGSVVVLLLGSSAVAAAFGAIRAGAAARRKEYTAAARTLTAWAEYPYRVRRRTSDSPETLSGLAERGHDLQEQLADRQAWCSAEHPLLGDLYGHLRSELAGNINKAIGVAWNAEPINAPGQMELGSTFPVDTRVKELLACFNACAGERFGWRRLRPRTWLARRLNAHLTARGFSPLP